MTQFYVIVQYKGTDSVDLKIEAPTAMAACERAEREAAEMDNRSADLPDYFARFVRPWSEMAAA